MEKLYPVGWNGAMSPVLANSKAEAESKLSAYLKQKGYYINHIFAYDPSESYNEWVRNFKLEIIQ